MIRLVFSTVSKNDDELPFSIAFSSTLHRIDTYYDGRVQPFLVCRLTHNIVQTEYEPKRINSVRERSQSAAMLWFLSSVDLGASSEHYIDLGCHSVCSSQLVKSSYSIFLRQLTDGPLAANDETLYIVRESFGCEMHGHSFGIINLKSVGRIKA